MLGERSFMATTANLDTMANAMTPLAFLPIPRSSTLLEERKKSVLEKRRLEDRSCIPVLVLVSKATQ